MKALLSRIWHFLRELSGEAALERRMAGCGCFKRAVTEAYEGNPHRCC